MAYYAYENLLTDLLNIRRLDVSFSNAVGDFMNERNNRTSKDVTQVKVVIGSVGRDYELKGRCYLAKCRLLTLPATYASRVAYLSKFLIMTINRRPGWLAHNSSALHEPPQTGSIPLVKNNFWNLHGRITSHEPLITRRLCEYECSIRRIPITTNGSTSILAYTPTGIPRKAVRRPVKPPTPQLSIFY